MKEEQVRPIDSCVVRYRNNDTVLELDSIMYRAPGTSRKAEYSDKRDFSLRKLTIYGRNAEIIFCYETELAANYNGLNYAAVLYVPDLPRGRGNLTIWTYSRSSDTRALATKILESVRFDK